MRVWIDMTAPAHPVVLRPVINRLVRQGHEVTVTARDYAQTLELLDRFGIEYQVIGRHGGASRIRKLVSLLGRVRKMRRAGKAGFDVAIAHGSNELPIVASWLGIPAADTFDYEWATQQHNIGCRLARRVVTPEAIPPERLARYGVDSHKLAQYPGLKEEYYLEDFEPDERVVDELGLDRRRVIVTVRPPPDVSLYHRKSNRVFPLVLEHLGPREDVHAVVVPRTPAQRDQVRRLRYPSLVVPDHAIDAQSLIAFSDLVVSAGGTMNREAVALGTPVYSTYGGRLGGVDEWLMREGRLRPLTDPRAMVLQKHNSTALRTRRDPQLLTDLLMGAAE
jgi:predicted glycosyltransferase